MLTDNLFEKILKAPSRSFDQLNIISGYASPAMANKHIASIDNNISIDLIVGMASQDGIGLGSHNGFKKLNQSSTNFKCGYVTARPPVHVKSYIWLSRGEPQLAFTGSGNYSQNAFFGGTVESFSEDDPTACNELFLTIASNAINCLDPNIDSQVSFYKEFYRRSSLARPVIDTTINTPIVTVPLLEDSVTLSLLSSRDGQTHQQSGLNWGQRPGREPNQAYIPIPANIARSGFFPSRANHFTLITDDGESLDCVVAQDGDKAIHTSKNNSIMGRYFRRRLGVPEGNYVTTQHLNDYGRTDVKITKIDDETYFLDFSV